MAKFICYDLAVLIIIATFAQDKQAKVRFMKRISQYLNAILVVMAMCVCTSCDFKSSPIKDAIESAQSSLPMDLGMAGSLETLEFDESASVLTMTINVNEQLMNIEKIKAHQELMKKSMMMNWIETDFKAILDYCAKEGISLAVVYNEQTSDKSMTIKFAPDEIKSMLDDAASSNCEDKLDMQIQLTKLQLPMMVDEVTLLYDMRDNGEYVDYVYTVDEDGASMDYLRQNEEAFRENLLLNLQSEDLTLSHFTDLCKQCGRGVRYVYEGSNSGDEVVISFDNSEF